MNKSPDLKPIKILWRILKRQVHQRDPQNLEELKITCQEKWANTEQQCCEEKKKKGKEKG